jgi:tRNA A-37 threonylcarbamoyl transferase component Bud32
MAGEGRGAAPLREGDLLVGKYAIEARLGAGAMGEVWRARNVALGREVAIKVLRPEHANNREIAERFLREARTANLVRHPNVVDVLDVAQDESGAPFLVQELLEGQDLAGHMVDHGGRLPVDAAMKVLLPIVEAVAFAHGKGVVHRDLKPENVFLARTGVGVVPKLLDFGISHVHAEGGSRMTATGVALGTPAYMSPEQIKGARYVDVRTDVWALGVLIHEVLSGELPFQAETVADQFVQIATAHPTPLEIAAPRAPRAVARIVAKCLRRAPGERYADAGALLIDLRAAAAESTPAPPAVPSRPAVDRRPVRAKPELEPLGSATLEVAVMTPVRPVARFVSIRPAPTDVETRRLIASGAVALIALGAAGLVTLVDLWPEPWALAPFTTSLLSGAPPLVARAVALLIVGLGVAAGVQGWRLEPKGWGHFVTMAGALAVAVAVVAATTGQASGSALPWAAAVAAVGVGGIALRGATDAWMAEVRGTAVLLAGVATLALVVARQLVR